MNNSFTVRDEVENALINDERTQNATIDVISDQGIVTLLGEVESSEIAQAAEEIARSPDGVIKVINSLIIKSRNR
ncbi:MAG: BON domain-containing protein [Anaerolineales bacterium]